jgi:PKD repeat protein
MRTKTKQKQFGENDKKRQEKAMNYLKNIRRFAALISRRAAAYLALAAFCSLALLAFTPVQITNAAFCDEMAKTATFLKCSGQETTFTNFQGGLTPPNPEGYAPELTQSTSAREFALTITNFVLGFLGLITVLAIIYGGVLYVTSGVAGDDKAEQGKKAIFNSVIGILIILSSWAIVNTVLKAPTGSDSTPDGVLADGSGGTSTAGSINFQIVAGRVQTISRDFITAYENYLEIQEAIQNLENISNVGLALDAQAFASNMRTTLNSISEIENKSYRFGVLNQIARINRIFIEALTSRVAKSDADARSSDFKNFVKEIENAASNLLGVPYDATVDTSGRSIQKAKQNYQNANKIDFQLMVEKVLVELGDTINPVFSGNKIYEIDQVKTGKPVFQGNSELVAEMVKLGLIESTDKQPYYFLQNPKLSSEEIIKQNAVGVNYFNAFNSINQSKENPTNQNMLRAIEDLEKLYESVKDLRSIYAAINASTTEGSAPLTINFDAVRSISPSGKTITADNVQWDLDGDGKFETEKKISINKTFNTPGTYRVGLKIKSDDKANVIDGYNSITINVTPPKSHIDLKYKVSGKAFPVMEWSGNSDAPQLKVNRNTIAVTLAEAQAGIEFDASATKDRFFVENKMKRFTWDFGDNSQIADQVEVKQDAIIKHSYGKGGTYRVQLEVEDETGQTDRKIFTVIVRDTAARISVLPSEKAMIGDELTFDGSASSATAGQITRYTWELTPASTPKITLPNTDSITHKFVQPGIYTVKLIVEDSSGNKSEESLTVEITSAPPIAQFLFSIPRQNQPSIVHLDGSKSIDPDGDGIGKPSGLGLSYKWEINADSSSYRFDPPLALNTYLTDKTRPIIRFLKKGDYEVSLTVRDKSGMESQRITRNIRIDKLLGVDWAQNSQKTARLDRGEARINFRASASNAESFEIRYGDGEKDSGPVGANGEINTTHTYKQAGTYEITLIVFDQENDETLIQQRVFISDGTTPTPVIEIGVNSFSVTDLTSPQRPLIVGRSDLINFDASNSTNLDGTQRRLDYRWDFGDGQSSTSRTVARSYKELSPRTPGYFPVRLTVIDKDTLKSASVLSFVRVVPREPYFSGITMTPQSNELRTPFRALVQAAGAQDEDGEITQYRWWYYDVRDPDNKLGLHLTTTPQTNVNIGTKGREGDQVSFRFGLEIIDNENYRFSSDDLTDQGAIPAITLTNGPNKPPQAAFSVDRTSISVGDSVTFTSSSTDSDGKIVSYVWDFEGDGFFNNQATRESTVTHRFTKAAPRGIKVGLKVIDDNYAEATANPITIYIESKSAPPVAAFKAEQTADLTLKFTNNSTADTKGGANLGKFTWDFDVASNFPSADSDGDGVKDNDTDSNEKEPTFKYDQPGSYRVKLTVEDSVGNRSEVVNLVEVRRATTVPVPNSGTNTQTPADPFGINKPLTVPAPTGETPSTPIRPSAPQTPLRAKLTTTPQAQIDGIVYLKAPEDLVTFNFSESTGEIVAIYIDKNIFVDTNGNGLSFDDKDYFTNKLGTWRTNFKREWGETFKARLTVEDKTGGKHSVDQEITFRQFGQSPFNPTKNQQSPNTSISRLSANLLGGVDLVNFGWLLSGALFAIIGLKPRKKRAKN